MDLKASILVIMTSLSLAGCGDHTHHQNQSDDPCAKIKADGEPLTIVDGWVREAQKGRTISAAYLTICNNTNDQDRLERVKSTIAKASEVHETTTTEDGRSTMTPLSGVEISGNDHVSLKQGGKHVMLIGLQDPLLQGDEVMLDLYFKQAGKVTVSLPVRSDNSSQKNGSHSEHHGNHH